MEVHVGDLLGGSDSWCLSVGVVHSLASFLKFL